MSSSFGNTPNPWASTYDTYSDCSQGLCSVYCPQWCYLVLPPPPPFFGLDTGPTSSSSPDFSPLIIVLIGILASAFLLVSYYTLVSKHCRGSPNDSARNDTNRNDVESEPHSQQQQQGADSEGLEEGLIKSIKVYRYKKSEGVVDVADCSVCLSEFEENDGLRMLPKCNHAFHVPCIDTWLKSHSSCPLCRSNIAVASTLVLAQRAVRSAEEAAVVVVVEGSSEEVEVVSFSVPKSPMIISDRLLVADILLRQDDDDDDDDDDDVDVVAGHHHHMESGMSFWYGDDNNVSSSNNNNNIGTSSGTQLGLMMRSPLASSRSISNGGTFAFTNYGNDKNSSLRPSPS